MKIVDNKKIMSIIGLLIVLIIISAVFIHMTHDNKIEPQVNTNNTNMTNVTKNATLNNTNTTSESVEDSSSQGSGSSDGGSESYVERWDRSQQENDGWAYTHDQPVKTDSDGERYARVYHEDTGKSSWESMSPGSI